MSVTHVFGVDPGVVHTGVVYMKFDARNRYVGVGHKAVAGTHNLAEVQQFIGKRDNPAIFIEGFRPRSHFKQDAEMMAAVKEMRTGLKGAVVLDNTGVKKVIRRPLMELLGVWSFSTPTHHQDLRSAARIALLGMVKDEQMNRLIATVVRSHLRGQTWKVVEL